jgi:hypothetical protein
VRFRNGESTEYVIYKWMDREWIHWDGPFTAQAGHKALEEKYNEKGFCLVQQTSFLRKRGGESDED